MAYEQRTAFITRHQFTFTFEQLQDIADDCLQAADYSAAHDRRVRQTLQDSPTSVTFLRVIWNACSWAGLDPQRQLTDWIAVGLADAMADDDDDLDTDPFADPFTDASYEDDGDSFELLLIEAGDWNSARAGDCESPEDFAVTLHEMDIPNLWF